MATLDKDTVARPELWRLVIMIGPNDLDVALYPPVAREEIIWHNFKIDPDAPSRLKAIEDIIYSNPLLLSDFRKIDCIIDTPTHVIAPASSSTEECEKFLSLTLSRDLEPESLIEADAGCDARIVQAAEPEVLPFLKRTFYNARFHGRLPLLTNYFANISQPREDIKVTALVRDSRLTLIVLDGKRLLVANDFLYKSVTDAAYYVLSALSNLSVDFNNPQLDISIHGESLTANGTLTEILRRYIPHIKAVPFPTLRFRASKNTLQIPYPLLILPICES